MLDVLFDNVYYRFLIAAVLALVLTFSDELDVLRKPWMLVAIGSVTLLMIMFDVTSDLGITMLMVSLFIVVYNLQTMKKQY
jgi:C4-dicarboxylate transporter